MKNIPESINDSVMNEALREIPYRVHFLDLGISANISVRSADQKTFEKWLEDEEDNTFDHVTGGNVEY